jgi:hypothetical protein
VARRFGRGVPSWRFGHPIFNEAITRRAERFGHGSREIRAMRRDAAAVVNFGSAAQCRTAASPGAGVWQRTTSAGGRCASGCVRQAICICGRGQQGWKVIIPLRDRARVLRGVIARRGASRFPPQWSPSAGSCGHARRMPSVRSVRGTAAPDAARDRLKEPRRCGVARVAVFSHLFSRQCFSDARH